MSSVPSGSSTSASRAYQAVASDLVRLIQTEYEIGSRLPPERELAKLYSVSRPTIREALLALSIAGMVEIRSKGGVYITQRHAAPDLSRSGIGPFETVDARLLVEPEIAALAASNATPEMITELRASQALMEESLAQGQDLKLGDHRFHVALASSTGNSMLAAICDLLWKAQLDSPIWAEANRKSRLDHYWKVWIDDHATILQAVELGSAIRARSAMIRHLDNIRSTLVELTATTR